MGKTISATAIGMNARKARDFAALLNGSGEFRCRALALLPDKPPEDFGKGSQLIFLFPAVEFERTGAWIAALRPAARMLLLVDDLTVSRLVLLSALEAGVDGIVTWPISMCGVREAISVVNHGGTPIPPELTTLLLDRLRSGRHVNPEWHLLTPREARVMAAVRDGLSYKLVAERLGIKVGTVQNHMNHVFEKLEVHSGTSALAKLFCAPATEPSLNEPAKPSPRKPRKRMRYV